MNIHPVYMAFDNIMLVFNILIAVVCFGVQKRRLLPASILGGALLIFNTVVFLVPAISIVFEYIPVSMLWIAVLYILNGGHLFSKLFVYFGAFYITLFLYVSSSFIAEIFHPYESRGYFMILAALSLTLFTVYGALAWRYARRICEKLFKYARTLEWAIYMTVPVFSLVVMGYGYLTRGFVWYPLPLQANQYFILLPGALFICIVFIVLAILKTEEKYSHQYEAMFARSIINTGHGHYQKMNELYDKLRCLQHDYKYHLNAVRKMIIIGKAEDAGKYLTHIEDQLCEYEMKKYCQNSVLNALVTDYAERCKKLNIDLDLNLDIPETLLMPDYDLCIVLGNLLENAVEACEKLAQGRFIKLETKNIREQLLFMAKNSFNGVIQHDQGRPLSDKINGGYGLQSIKEVMARHNGDFTMEWDKDTFTAFFAVRK